MRARGLKQIPRYYVLKYAFVAPHAGAWVETHYLDNKVNNCQSRPMRARGLKHQDYD